MSKQGRRNDRPEFRPIILEDARSKASESPFKSRLQFASTGQFIFFLFLAFLWIVLVSIVCPLAESHWPSAEWVVRAEIGSDILGLGAVAILAYRRWENVMLMFITVFVALLMQQAFVGHIQSKDLSAAVKTGLEWLLKKADDKPHSD